MSNNSTIRNEVNKLAQQIETMARQVQDKIAQGSDVNGLIGAATELVRNSNTFTFIFGHMAALEDNGKTIKATVVSNPNSTKTRNQNYHNVRDSLGRFTRV